MPLKYGKYKKARMIPESNGSYTLDLPELSEEDIENLPTVSVVTITKDRSEFVSSMLFIWSKYIYPPEKLEWIILDDSQDPDQNLGDYLPEDERIKYFKVKEWMPIDKKRNAANSLAKNEIIVHMDDDDYYFPDSILAKVRTMLHYDKIGVLTWEIAVYDLKNRKSFITHRPDHTNNIAEATIAYRRSYWESHPFSSENDKGMGEGESFIDKFRDWVDIHFLFNSISITHSKNVTENSREFQKNDNNDSNASGDLFTIFPDNYKLILNNIDKLLKK